MLLLRHVPMLAIGRSLEVMAMVGHITNKLGGTPFFQHSIPFFYRYMVLRSGVYTFEQHQLVALCADRSEFHMVCTHLSLRT